MPAAHIVLAEATARWSASSPSIRRQCISIRSWSRPKQWGSGVALALLDEAKRLSPTGLDLLVNKDNARAIRFYEKHGFVYAGEDKNPVSGKPVNRMAWRPPPHLRSASKV